MPSEQDKARFWCVSLRGLFLLITLLAILTIIYKAYFDYVTEPL